MKLNSFLQSNALGLLYAVSFVTTPILNLKETPRCKILLSIR